MEHLILQSIVQGGDLGPGSWACLGDYWQWSFWIGCLVGLIGTVVLFFFRPSDSP